MRDDLQYASIRGNANVNAPISGTANMRIPVQGLLSVGAKQIKELRFLPISEFPETGQLNILYIDTTNSVIYYWDGIEYKELSGSGGGDSGKIYAKTTAEWAQAIDVQSQYGAIYIYTDYRQEDNVNIPAMKIGDGMAYVVDLPFFSTGVTEKDRERWDNKVTAFISPLDPENVIFSTD